MCIAQKRAGATEKSWPVSHSRKTIMEELLCNVEFLKSDSEYLARVESEIGGMREYRSASLEEILEQVIIDLQEEFESAQL